MQVGRRRAPRRRRPAWASVTVTVKPCTPGPALPRTQLVTRDLEETLPGAGLGPGD